MYNVDLECDSPLKHEIVPDKNVEMFNKQKLFNSLKHGWDTFHKYFVYILIAVLLGIYIGITVSKTYFNDKMEDSIKIQGFVFKNQIYSITPK